MHTRLAMSVVIQVPSNTTTVYVYDVTSDDGQVVLRSAIQIVTATEGPDSGSLPIEKDKVNEEGKVEEEEDESNGGGSLSEKPFACGLCKRKCWTADNLRTHFLTMHTQDRPHACNDCGKKFALRCHLARHATNVHGGQRPFVCEICGRAFTQRGHHTAHVRRHGGARPFPCNVCDKRFKDRSGLVQHTRRHTGERPYPCNDCDRAFYRRSDLTAHRRLHARGTEVVVVEAETPATTDTIDNDNGGQVTFETLLNEGIQWPLEGETTQPQE